MHKNDIYDKYISDSLSKFKSNLLSKKEYESYFYILNKDFVDNPKKIGNSNKNLLIEYDDDDKIEKILNPEESFYILDKAAWSKIKSDYPDELEIKIEGSFSNNKFIFKITNKIYYFYFIISKNEKIINEGFFKFPTHITENIIIQKFLELDINSFFEEMNINKTNNIQKIYYNNRKFLLRLKKINIDNKNNN